MTAKRFECPVCHREMMGPDEVCGGAFTERDHPSAVKAVPSVLTQPAVSEVPGNSGGVEEAAVVAGAHACAYLLADEPQARLELIAQRVLEGAAPTQPQLSDEDRERIGQLANEKENEGLDFDAALLRNLAERGNHE
jgi:hypothetical protein